MLEKLAQVIFNRRDDLYFAATFLTLLYLNAEYPFQALTGSLASAGPSSAKDLDLSNPSSEEDWERVRQCFNIRDGLIAMNAANLGLVRINTLFQHSEKYRHPWRLLVIPSFRCFIHELNMLNIRNTAS